MRKIITRAALLGGIGLGLTGCADPYSPGQRAVGGGLLGAGAGAALGSLSGNPGTGALIGGGLGAVGGAATTPDRPRPHYDHRYDHRPPPGYGGGY